MTIHGDHEGLIRRAELRAGNRRAKVKQAWHGQVSVETDDGPKLAKLLGEVFSHRWQITDLVHGQFWVSFRAIYVAKGADMYDVVKLLDKLAAEGHVTINAIERTTTRVTPVEDV